MKKIKIAHEKKRCDKTMPSGVADFMAVYKRFQEANSITEKYLDIISPKTHQFTSSQSFIIEST